MCVLAKENEARVIIEGYLGDDEVINEALEMASKSLEEIQAYRAIGTVEECEEVAQLKEQLAAGVCVYKSAMAAVLL